MPSHKKAKGAESVSVDSNDVPSFSFEKISNIVRRMRGVFERIDYFLKEINSKKTNSNTSTMEDSNKESVGPPEDSIMTAIEAHYRNTLSNTLTKQKDTVEGKFDYGSYVEKKTKEINRNSLSPQVLDTLITKKLKIR